MEEFYEQYNVSKQMALHAIEQKQNVVLLGKGSNGKTYLTNELIRDGYLDINEYRMISIEYECKDLEKKNCWVECRYIDYAMNKLDNQSFVLINMNTYKCPNATGENGTTRRNCSPWYYGNVIDAYGHC